MRLHFFRRIFFMPIFAPATLKHQRRLQVLIDMLVTFYSYIFIKRLIKFFVTHIFGRGGQRTAITCPVVMTRQFSITRTRTYIFYLYKGTSL